MNQVDSKRTLWAWAMYDFANSAFTTLVVTFIYGAYFTKGIAPDEMLGTQWWSWAIAVTAIIVSFLSPVLGALSDVGGYRKWIMMLSTWCCVAATAFLFFPQQGQVFSALILFVLANVSFEFGTVFCNAYLPEIVSKERIGRASGFAWALGYIGGLLALGIALILLVQPEIPILGFSIENGENIRATNLLVALWFLVFSIPTFIWLQDRRPEKGKFKESVATSFKLLFHTFQELKKYRIVARFLLARLVYNDALVTIFAFGGIYAAGVIGFTFEEIMILGIVLNITAGLGAFLMGYLDDSKGSQKTVQWSILFLSFACLLGFVAPIIPTWFADVSWLTSKLVFWIAAILIGFFSGPNQSASRSLMAHYTPAEKRNEFFGFYAFSGKATSFLGPLLFGWVTAMFGNQQAGILVVLTLFLFGYVLMKRV
tara:strand:+ start:460 stop:1740 length:1281 start_codon:yes stop_codon:yes gene_type:complete